MRQLEVLVDIYHSQYAILSPDSSSFDLSVDNTCCSLPQYARHCEGAHYYHAQREEEAGREEEDIVRDVLSLPPVWGAALPTDLGAEPAPAKQGRGRQEQTVAPAEEDHQGHGGPGEGRLGTSLKTLKYLYLTSPTTTLALLVLTWSYITTQRNTEIHIRVDMVFIPATGI